MARNNHQTVYLHKPCECGRRRIPNEAARCWLCESKDLAVFARLDALIGTRWAGVPQHKIPRAVLMAEAGTGA